MKRNRGGLLITGRRFLALPQRQLLRILNRGKAARVLYLERISCFLILSKYSPRGRYRAYLGPCRCSAMAGSICLLFVWASGGSQPTPGPAVYAPGSHESLAGGRAGRRRRARSSVPRSYLPHAGSLDRARELPDARARRAQSHPLLGQAGSLLRGAG